MEKLNPPKKQSAKTTKNKKPRHKVRGFFILSLLNSPKVGQLRGFGRLREPTKTTKTKKPSRKTQFSKKHNSGGDCLKPQPLKQTCALD